MEGERKETRRIAREERSYETTLGFNHSRWVEARGKYGSFNYLSVSRAASKCADHRRRWEPKLFDRPAGRAHIAKFPRYIRRARATLPPGNSRLAPGRWNIYECNGFSRILETSARDIHFAVIVRPNFPKRTYLTPTRKRARGIDPRESRFC